MGMGSSPQRPLIRSPARADHKRPLQTVFAKPTELVIFNRYARRMSVTDTSRESVSPTPKPVTPVEGVKETSRALRGTLAAELADLSPSFTADATHLIKFHGFYQQDDRDIRKARAAKKLPLEYSCMVRASVPGGRLTAVQWSAMDGLASAVADGSMRLTTRQGVQFHFVQKSNLRELIATLNAHLVTTLAACGDVVRNVMSCPAPLAQRGGVQLGNYASEISAAFKPTTRAYYDLFIDHEHAATAVDPRPEVDALYGETYLPRKFKIVFAWPGDNCVDLYSHDLGFVPVLSNGTSGEIEGWTVFAGGGMGQNHSREDDTYPRLASVIGTVGVNDLRAVGETIIGIFRDTGDRTDRGRARLKYAIDDRGLDWFIAEVRSRLESQGVVLHEAAPLVPWDDSDEHLGWQRQHDGNWFLGVHVESGRVRDLEDGVGHGKVRSALAELATSGLVPEFLITARQDVLLAGIVDTDRVKVEEVLTRYNVPLAHLYEPVRRLAVACPALPTCGQALAEAERILPRVVDDAANALNKAGLRNQELRINMTGCPNGCARPYTSEIGVVGRGKRSYDIYVGGAVGGDRLNQRIGVDVDVDDLSGTFSALFDHYAKDRSTEGESFGEWSNRVGPESLKPLVPVSTRRRKKTDGDDA
jgi:sulfite reductase (ferredoxin)